MGNVVHSSYVQVRSSLGDDFRSSVSVYNIKRHTYCGAPSISIRSAIETSSGLRAPLCECNRQSIKGGAGQSIFIPDLMSRIADNPSEGISIQGRASAVGIEKSRAQRSSRTVSRVQNSEKGLGAYSHIGKERLPWLRAERQRQANRN